MDKSQINATLNSTKEYNTSDKPENNLPEFLFYISIYLTISLTGLLLNYIQSFFSGKKVLNILKIKIIYEYSVYR